MSSFKDLDFALGYYGVIPKGFRGAKEDTLIFTEDCPPDIKEKVLELWPKLRAKEKEDEENGIFRDVY